MHAHRHHKALIALAALVLLLIAHHASAAERYVFVKQWGSAGSTPGAFDSPFGLAVDESCNVYVADAGNNRIQKFTSAGTLLTYWGTAGTIEPRITNVL